LLSNGQSFDEVEMKQGGRLPKLEEEL